MTTMDSIDERLARLLQENARRSSTALAKQLLVSPSTIRRRIKKLVESGALRIGAVVDARKFGFPLTAIIAFRVEHNKLEKVVQSLVAYNEVRWISTTTGRFDILALVRFRSSDELSNFLQRKLNDIEGLSIVETFLCLSVVKGQYVLI